jgi:outer membrane receptor protein involved in Fe transport
MDKYKELSMRSAKLAASVLLSVSMLIGSAWAQSASGSILGRVTDPQGAAVPNANITVINVATQVTNKTQSDSEGSYRVLNLPIGIYKVTAEHEGFAKLVTEDRTLQINQQERMDLKLVVGARAEIVEVTDVGTDVETVSPTLGDSVTSRPIVNLPLNGRNVLDLALLQPGVTEDNPDDTGAGTFNIAGGRADSVTFLLDGGEDNDLLDNSVVFTPNPDAVAEFRILKSNYSAEYGRNAGGIVSLVTKSGTNQLHGTLFDFARNDAFNANDYFDIRAGNPREVLKRQQFGLTLGGPILLPKIHGRDKFFWFFSYQGQRQTEKAAQPGLNVYTPAELNGDFSGAPYASDIATFLQANPYFQANPALAAQGIIDPTKINSIAQNYIKAGLMPTAPNGVLNAQSVATDNRNELTFKFDFNVTAKDRLSVTLGRNTNPSLVPFAETAPNPATTPGFATIVDNDQYFLNTAFTHTFSSNLLNEFRFTTQRSTTLNAEPASPAKSITAATLGVGITPDDPTGPPRIAFYQSGTVVGFNYQGPTTFADNTFSYLDTFSWVKGRHSMKFGFNFSDFQDNVTFDYLVNGEFDFDGSAGGIGSGHDLADFLFGLPDFYSQFPRAPSNIRTRDYYAFAQDEWRVTPRLVLSYGLRYEYGTPKRDTLGRSFSVIPGLQSTRFVNAPLGLVFPGDKGAPNGVNFPNKTNFAPRFGFAWDPQGDAKTSVRGGIGMFYDILKGEDNLQFNGQAPFFSSVSLQSFSPLNGTPPTVNYLAQPFLANGATNPFPSQPPTSNLDFNAAGFIPFGGSSVYFVDPHLRTPYSYQYNLSIQREVARNLMLELAYVGSSSHGLTSLLDINPFALGATTNRILGPNFGFLDEFKNVVNANYNGLDASLTKQVSNSKSFGNTYFTLAYTWAKSIDNASGFSNRNFQVPSYQPALFRSVSDFDLRNRIVFSGGWDLPFDNLWASSPKRLTSGWSLYPIVSWRTGFPLDVLAGYRQDSGDPGPSGAGDANLVRADLAGSSVPTVDPRAHPDPVTGGNIYFPASIFSIPSDPSTAPTYGSLPRNFFRGPGRTNVDMAVAKTTNLYSERVSLEFRVEAFNVFNHAEFANPDTTFGSPTFGEITSTTIGILETQRILQLGARIKF